MDLWEFTKKKYPELAEKGYCFRGNMERDASKRERRHKKKWCRDWRKQIFYDGNYFAIDFGIIRDDLPAYYNNGITEISSCCPFFGKFNTADFRRASVKWLWAEFGDVPINEDEEIDEDWHIFSKGTDRFEIWHWFEETYDISIASLQCT